MRISDGSSDVCSSDLLLCLGEITNFAAIRRLVGAPRADQLIDDLVARVSIRIDEAHAVPVGRTLMEVTVDVCGLAEAEAVLADLAAAFEVPVVVDGEPYRSEEHTSELQSLMRISYAVFCLKKKKHQQNQ